MSEVCITTFISSKIEKLSHLMRAAPDIKILKSLVNIEWGIFSQDFELSSRILNLEKNIFFDFETLHNFCHPLLFMFWIDIICHVLVQCGIKITLPLPFTYNYCHRCPIVSFYHSHRKGKLILGERFFHFKRRYMELSVTLNASLKLLKC